MSNYKQTILVNPDADLVIWVQLASDGMKHCVQKEAIPYVPWVERECKITGRGLHNSSPIQLPKQVNGDTLQQIIAYAEFHGAKGRSDKERKCFDARSVALDTRRLCELTSAADALDMKALVDLTSKCLAKLIEGKSPDEIREAFNLPDDLSPEEKLEHLPNVSDDPRLRLLNRLYAKKRRELQVKREAEESRASCASPVLVGLLGSDCRSVDELLSFIGDSSSHSSSDKPEPCRTGKASNSKKKKKKPTSVQETKNEGSDTHHDAATPKESQPACSAGLSCSGNSEEVDVLVSRLKSLISDVKSAQHLKSSCAALSERMASRSVGKPRLSALPRLEDDL